MTDELLKRGWPQRECQLLLKALFLQEDNAKEAWNVWKRSRDLTSPSWAEKRLLSQLSARIRDIESDKQILSQVMQVRTFVLRENQKRLNLALPAIDLLASQQIPVMTFKGGARVVQHPTHIATRYMRDLDLLIPRDRIDEAVDLLLANRYRPLPGKLPGFSKAVDFDRQYAGEGKETRGEIDIHRCILRYGRRGEFDEELWSRAKELEFRGRKIWIPSPADQLVICLAHGLVIDKDRPADWATDAMLSITEPDFTWEALIQETLRRRVAVSIKAGLSFLQEVVQLEIPGYVMQALDAPARDWLFRWEFYSDTGLRQSRRSIDCWMHDAAEWRRSRRNPRRDRIRVTGWAGRPIATPRGQPISTNSDLVEARAIIGPNYIQVDLSLDEQPQDRVQFDLVCDGLWLGRLRIRPTLAASAFGLKTWRFKVPLDQPVASLDSLEAYLLDEHCYPIKDQAQSLTRDHP